MTLKSTRNPRRALVVAAALALLVAPTWLGSAGARENPLGLGVSQLRLIHLADTHGKLAPHWERLADGRWHERSGGLAKAYTVVRRLRETAPGENLLLVNGDNFHGSAELFFTRGQAVVPILNAFGIDAYSPGNWDFADGPADFRARFTGPAKLTSFPVVAAGVYNAPGAPPGAAIGQRVLPPYVIKEVGGLRVAVIGLNDDKPHAQAKVFTIGLELTAGFDELPSVLEEVRRERPDLVVVMSEAGLAQNVALARDVPGIDVLLSSDTHEETFEPIVVPETGTVVVESGQGAAHVGRLDLRVVKSASGTKILERSWRLEEVDETVPEDARIKGLVDAARAPFLSGTFKGPFFRPYPGWRPGSRYGMVLDRPIDTVIGSTDVDLSRRAVFETVGDNLIADAMRIVTGADIAGTNGFRYDSELPAGEKITIGDVFNWLPLGAHVAVGEMSGGQILERFERYLSSVFDPNPYRRGGGWVPRVSGIRFHVDLTGPHGSAGDRIVRAEVLNRSTGAWEALLEDKWYRIASCYGPGDPLDHLCRTSGVRDIRFLTKDGQLVPPRVTTMPPNPRPKVQAAPDDVMSAPELMLYWIESAKDGVVAGADYSDPRWIVERGSLPASPFGSPVVQPLQGLGPDWLAAERVGAD